VREGSLFAREDAEEIEPGGGLRLGLY